MLLNAMLFLGALAGMEAVAYYAHKYVMHGFLWSLHESHHVPGKGRFEKNDLFAVFFAVPSIVLIYLGVHVYDRLLWVGLGIAAYGLVYFAFHDLLVHRRIRHSFKPKRGYLARVVQAHYMHHATREKEGAVSFGFVYAPSIEKLKAERARIKAQAQKAAEKRRT
ncbi:MAG: sterol desaturase family protein [Gemmatimonadota bacterium]|nr:MAG: sterol desaturase family protein [Gemmatimonadota bacterium]